jgi:transcriptional regulator with XRE-family HTH domain
MRLDHERVRWHRDRLGWTLDTLAEKAEVAKGTVLRAEHGEDVRPSSGRRIARALGVETSDLIPDKPRRARELIGTGKADAPEAGPDGTEAAKLDVPFMAHPQVRDWLAENGHVTRQEFLSYVEGLGPDELDITEDGWPQGLENAVGELRRKRDSLQQELRKSSTHNTLFPAQMQGLTTKEEREREALRPGRDAWKLAEEIRREYSARERTLMAYGRWLHYQGITAGHLVYAPLVESERRRMLEGALTEAS